MGNNQISVKILRFLPEKGTKQFWQTYTLEAEPEATILEILNNIHWYQDGTLAYRRSCRSAICGSCAMKVNGQNVLACETPLFKFKGKTLKIEPLPGFGVIKDLVVDLESFFDKLNRIKPYLITSQPIPDKEFLQDPKDFDKIKEATLCILCGACTSSCPSLWGNENYSSSITSGSSGLRSSICIC